MQFFPKEMANSTPEQLDHRPESVVQLPSAETSAESSICDHPVSLDLRVVPLDAVPLQPLRWLWHGRIPLAGVTLLSGLPGSAQACVAADLAARVTRGNGVPPEPGLAQPASVLYLAADGAAGQTLRPRMQAAGADLARIHLVHLLREPGPIGLRPPPVSLADDVNRLAAALQGLPDVRLVVVDPVTAFLAGLDQHNAPRLAALVGDLARLAARCDAAMLLLASVGRPVSPAAVLRAVASAPLAAAVHTVLAIVDDPHVVGRRLLLPVKVDPLAAETVRAFWLRDGRLAWNRRAAEWTLDDLLSPAGRQLDEEDATQQAVDWLEERLSDGPVGIRAVRREARQRRIPRRILLRARRRLDVELVHDGRQSRWFYQLPPEPELDPDPPVHPAPLTLEQLMLEDCRRLEELQRQELS